jgi:ketosteroid isomerase-like protein
VSSDNVEIVRRIYDAVARREPATAFAVYAEDVVWEVDDGRATLMSPVYRGHEGVRQFWRDGLSAFGNIDLEAEELIEAGDKVVAVVRERSVGRASGVPVDASHAAVWTLSDGVVVHMKMFSDRDHALRAVGLLE